jgi:hypothetical protein
MSSAAAWVPPPVWSVPREWPGERCFVLCSGESIKPQAGTIAQLRGRFIAVKHGVYTRPDADVLFLSGEGTEAIARQCIPRHTGKYIIVRGKSCPGLPDNVKRVTRHKDHEHFRPDLAAPAHVGGYDSGTSAIHLAYLFGATEIVLCGYDMQGGHFCAHPMPYPPEEHFRRHMVPLEALAKDAKAKGIRIVNCSPTSRVTAFERKSLESFL